MTDDGVVVKRKGRFTPRRLIIWLLLLAGPGLIAANAGNDAGGIATYASAGAQFGYHTLFFMLLVTVALIVVQEMCARLGAITGDGLGSLIREHFSIRMATFALVAFVIANVGLVVSEFAGIAAALQLFHVSRYISVPIAAISLWALIVYGTYAKVEKIFLLLSMAFLAYPIAAIFAHPNWGTAATQLLSPHFIYNRDFLLLGVALIGTTITPYMQFYITAAIPDKGIGAQDYKRARVDAVAGSIFADIISIFIIIATAAAITVRAPLSSAAQAANALRPVAGQFAGQLFGIGLLGASALAAAVVPLSTAYAVSEASGSERSVGKRFSEAPLFVGLFTAQIVLGAAIALIPSNLIATLINAQILNGIITPILLTYILILANKKSLLGNAANGPIFKTIATICVTIIGILSIVVLTTTISSWFGFSL
jgi:NRAMP (natural resistance-associated macrophage protein)-like metal ion transporter